MKLLKIIIFQILTAVLLDVGASTEWFTKLSPSVTDIFFNQNKILIHEFSTQSKLKCIHKCILFASTCQFLQFTNRSKCTIYNSIQKENPFEIEDFYLREKKLVKIRFLNGSFMDRIQLINLPEVLNLSRNGINLIAPFAFAGSNKTTILNLSCNNLTIIYSKSFYGLIYLKTLNLSFNQISRLESDVFKDLSLLAFLDLRYNSLKFLNGNIFDNLQLLQDINLEFNQIDSIERYTFKNLNKLEKIILNNNCLKVLEPLFHNLISFTFLDVSSNQIRFVHNYTFMSFQKLAEILISSNQIFEINSETFKGAQSLKKIDVSVNKIQKVDANFSMNVASLKQLDMSKNNLSFISPDIFIQLVNLESLRLDSCNIKVINLNSLVKLKYLFLRNNFINFFSQNLSSLIELRLTYNPLGNLTYPLITSQNSALTTLGISYCQLNYIDLNILRNFANLKILNIAGNLFTLNNDTFYGFKSLTVVSVPKEDITRFKIIYPNITFFIF
ncbi:unnamed protein product [Brachionus calyciflorus]|uniref:DCD domain-containing protein n=1 Tax=Brachionus calyciflorus TaxID=104777 RepID=A0A813SXC9_9BILA|nr:unnamed protein product [Brachionus calyciflorus]